MDNEYVKWAIGAVAVPIVVALIALLPKRRKVSQSQSQQSTGTSKQKQSQSMED